MRFAQRDFSLGEFSPRVLGRVDLDYYYRGARLMENYIALPQGGAERRPGTLLCDEFDTSRNYVVFPFVHGDDISHLVLISTVDILIYKVDPEVVFPTLNVEELKNLAGTPITFTSPYSGIGDLRDIQPYQYRRTLFFAHPDFLLHRMDYGEGDELAFRPFVPSYATFIASEAQSIGDIVAYDGSVWNPIVDMAAGSATTPAEGGGWWIEEGDATPGLGTVPAWSTGVYTEGQLVVFGEKVWKAKVILYDNIGWDLIWEIAGIHSPPVGSPTERPSGPGGQTGTWRQVGDALPAGTTALAAYNAGTTYSAGTIIYDDPLGKLYRSLEDANTGNDPTATTNWRKVGPAPSFNQAGRYPALVTVHEDRLVILGSREYPDAIFLSRTGRFDDMTLGVDDADAISFSLGGATGESISWARSRDALVIGTGESEWRVLGANGGPLTPTSIHAYLQTNSGGARGGAIDIGDMLVFLQSGGRRLLRFVFSNDQKAYSTPDVGMLSEHVFVPGVRQMALQTNPDFILWMVMADGTLVGATYDPGTQRFGWHRHNTDGDIFSIAVTPTGDGEDDVWLTVKREVNSVEYTFLEKFAPRRQETQIEWTYLDCATHFPITGKTITVNNNIYLQEIRTLVDGANHAAITPEGTLPAIVSLNYGSTTAVTGLPYVSKLRPQKYVPLDGELETDIRAAQLGLQLYKTLGMSVGADEDDGEMYPVVFQDTNQILGAAPTPFSGEKPQTIDMTFSDDEGIIIRQDGPFPGKVLGVIYSLMTGRNP